MIPLDNPFLMIVGPTKSGSTWVHRYLESRGDVALPDKVKETFFFDKMYDRGIDWYRGLFPNDSDDRRRAEVAPSYFHKPDARDRIATHLPNARIVFLIRDPADRAVSHYFHYRVRGEGACSLAEMVQRHGDVVEAGMYDKHSRAWIERFGHDRVAFVSYDLLRSDPDAFCESLCQALQLPYIPVAPDLSERSVNSAALPRNLLAARAVQFSTGFLRKHGLYRVIGALKALPIKRWVFSDGDTLGEERKRVQAQVGDLPQELRDDWQAFCRRTGIAA